MSDNHVPGHTTATATRPGRDFTGPSQVHRVEAEVDGLLEEARSNPSQRAAKTLSKDASLSVVLMAMVAGSEVKDHRAHGSALLQVAHGRLVVHLDGGEVALRAGDSISIAKQVPHRLAAASDCVLLLSVAGGAG